ncbi:MAG TPA: potassium transporter Kef [Desulfobulbus sp.]|nr:potassium transporter Kef [Desulfobulbus sp.]
METTPLWLIDAAWLSFAFVCGFIARLIKLPPLIGFLAAGFILNGLGIRQGGEALQELADLGVTLLLFTIGLKLDIKSLLRKEIWLGTTIHMLVSMVVFSTFIYLLSYTSMLAAVEPSTAVLFGFALSFSSTVYAVKTLEERGEAGSLHGVTAIGILVMQDIIAVIFLTVSTGKIPSAWALCLPLLYFLRPLFFTLLERTDHGELLTLFGLFMAMVVGSFSFEIVGLKPDLGALIAGILIGSHPKAKELSHTLMGFKNLFLVAFFLSIGLSGLPDMKIIIISLLLGLFIPFKGGLFFLLMSRFDFRARTALFTGFPLANYSEFGLIVAAVGVKNGWLEPQWLVLAALALTLSFVVGAPLNGSVYTFYARYKDFLRRFETARRHPADTPLEINADILIFGMGRIGSGAYVEACKTFPGKVAGVDNNRETVDRLCKDGMKVYLGDATDIDFWEKINPGRIAFVSLCMSSHAANMTAVDQLQQAGFSGYITATARHEDDALELEKAGAHIVYQIFANVGEAYGQYVRQQLAALGVHSM